MWTIIRFALSSADDARYRQAFELLRRAGFREHHVPDSARAGESFPAAAVGNVREDPSVVARRIFVALAEARLAPVMVSGVHAPRARSASPSAPLASA
jgi:hypothetical protein